MPREADASARVASELSESDIRAQLERILASDVFSRSRQLRRFLSFVVEQTLAGQGPSLKESVLAHELYEKGTDFDGGTDPVVRVDARRLRDKLREYYTGRTDPVVISLPKGSYAPTFEVAVTTPRSSTEQVRSPNPLVTPPVTSHSRSRGRLVIVALVTSIGARRRSGIQSSHPRMRMRLRNCFPWRRTQESRDHQRCHRMGNLSPSRGPGTRAQARPTSM